MRTALTPGERDLATIAQLAHDAAGHTGIALRCRDEECQETMGEILDTVRKGLLADAVRDLTLVGGRFEGVVER